MLGDAVRRGRILVSCSSEYVALKLAVNWGSQHEKRGYDHDEGFIMVTFYASK
jgi:hypothetical protein